MPLSSRFGLSKKSMCSNGQLGQNNVSFPADVMAFSARLCDLGKYASISPTPECLRGSFFKVGEISYF